MFFDTVNVTLVGSASFDPEGKPLTYEWKSSLSAIPIYKGTEPTFTTNLTYIGKQRLTLTVYDDLLATSSATINLTVFKKIIWEFKNLTIPAKCKLCFSEDTGIVDIVRANDPLSTPGAEAAYEVGTYVTYQFKTVTINDPYLIEWANISITYDANDLPYALNQSRLGLYYLSGAEWSKCDGTGVDVNASTVYANRTDIPTIPLAFAVGTYDNKHPNLAFPSYEPLGDNIYHYEVTYEDEDNDAPEFIKVIVDGVYEYPMEPVNPKNLNYTYKAYFTDLKISSGSHTYQIAASDGTIGTKTDALNGPAVPNAPPVADAGLNQNATLAKDGGGNWFVSVKFNGSGSYDPDMDLNGNGKLDAGEPNTLTYVWTINGETRQNIVNPDYTFYQAGTYVCTLNVSDGLASDSDTVTILVVKPGDDDQDDDTGDDDSIFNSATFLWIFALIVLLLIIVIVIAILVSRRKQEEKVSKTTVCPECGEEYDIGLPECPKCGAETAGEEDADEEELEGEAGDEEGREGDEEAEKDEEAGDEDEAKEEVAEGDEKVDDEEASEDDVVEKDDAVVEDDLDNDQKEEHEEEPDEEEHEAPSGDDDKVVEEDDEFLGDEKPASKKAPVKPGPVMGSAPSKGRPSPAKKPVRPMKPVRKK